MERVRILLADDDRLNLELYVDVLEDDGHEVHVEATGDAALSRALASSFDVVLLDIQMPGLDGNEVCRRLRAAGYHGPIAALSAAALPDNVRRGEAAGFDAYLTKPLLPRHLLAAVAALTRVGSDP